MAGEKGSIFLNFHDQRERKAPEVHELVRKTVDSIPAGNRVVLVLSKQDFGHVSMPLSLQGEEIIS